MARQNVPFLAFNRGIVSPKALARVDLDRTRLSAEVMTNWLPKSQGAMRIRPGTKWLGSSLNDSGAEWVEFVAATDDTALIELTHQKMRIWVDDALLERPSIATSLSITDTGWDNASTGGTPANQSTVDQIPTMTAATVNGVTVSSGGATSGTLDYEAADDNVNTQWVGAADTGLWWWKVDFGSGNNKQVKTHTIRATTTAGFLPFMPSSWRLESNDVDTGAGWTNEVFVSGQTGWAVGEKREFVDTGYSDTGGNSRRYWRIRILSIVLGTVNSPLLAEVEMFLGSGQPQADFSASGLVLNAGAIGSLAKAKKRVIVDTGDANVEHSLALNVTRGPVTLRCGSSAITIWHSCRKTIST
jgi:hypothetical protein